MGMGSMPPSAPPGMPMGGGAPSGAPGPAQGMGGLVSDPSLGGAGSPDPGPMLKQFVQMSSDIDQALMMLSQVMGTNGGDEVGQARKLVEQGVAKFVAAKGGSGSMSKSSLSKSPNASGGLGFTGGGFTSGGPGGPQV